MKNTIHVGKLIASAVAVAFTPRSHDLFSPRITPVSLFAEGLPVEVEENK